VQQRPVPAAKRLRTDGKARPPLGRKQPAHCREQGSVGRRVLRPVPSAPEDRELVAQNPNLKLPLTTTAGEHANESAEEPVHQRHQHDAQSEPALPRSPSTAVPAESSFFTPHARELPVAVMDQDPHLPALVVELHE
jgi:hypothetical protein